MDMEVDFQKMRVVRERWYHKLIDRLFPPTNKMLIGEIRFRMYFVKKRFFPYLKVDNEIISPEDICQERSPALIAEESLT